VSEREHGMLEGLPDNKLDVVPNALGWRLGRSNSAILARASRDKRGNGTPVRPSCGNEHGHFGAIRSCFAMPAGSSSPTSSGRASLAVARKRRSRPAAHHDLRRRSGTTPLTYRKLVRDSRAVSPAWPYFSAAM
jgi:hypothetical protein